MRRAVQTAALVALGALAAAGCGKKAAPGEAAKAGKAAPGAPFEDAVLTRLKDGGFGVGKFDAAPADAYGATRCVRGPVDRLDVLLCDYPSAEAATAADKRLKGFASGAVSGAARRAGTVGLAVADRDKVDLPGKHIAKLLRTFTGAPAAPEPAAPAAPAPAAPAAPAAR
ncbi:MAG TPA: hypothetical protein VGQ83_21605 [Polyangia bacterium]|jgi:hypothetical protein